MRPSSSRAAERAETGSDTTDQRSALESVLSSSAVKTCVPSGRSLAAIVTGTSNNGAKFLPHVELGILAADEDRDLAGPLGRFRLCGGRGIGNAAVWSFLASGRRRIAPARAVTVASGFLPVAAEAGSILTGLGLDSLDLVGGLRRRRSSPGRCAGFGGFVAALTGLAASADWSSAASAVSVLFGRWLAASSRAECAAGRRIRHHGVADRRTQLEHGVRAGGLGLDRLRLGDFGVGVAPLSALSPTFVCRFEAGRRLRRHAHGGEQGMGRSFAASSRRARR